MNFHVFGMKWWALSGSVVKNQPANAWDMGTIFGLGRSLGEENGNPLQCSRLENPMDRGALQATVHGIAKSQTRLSDFHFHFTLPLAPPGAITVAEAKPLVYVEKNFRDLPIYLVWENPWSDQIILITTLALLSITGTSSCNAVLLPGLCHPGTPSFLGNQDVISKEDSPCFSMWDMLLLFWLKHFSVLMIHSHPSTNPHP